MYNTRYHIASLVAVFLALALGLVLGGLVVRQGTFDSQQTALVRGLRAEFQDLTSENRTLKQRDELYTGFSATMTDSWVSSRLAGRAIAVVVNSGRVEGLSAATAAIESAGGQVVVITLEKPGFGLADKDVRAAVPTLTDNPDEQARAIATSLTAEWTVAQQDRPLTESLVKAKALSVEGLAPGMAVAGVVDLAVTDGKPEVAGLEILAACAAGTTPALAAEPPTADAGLAEAAAGRRFSAIDSLGLEPGRYSLVALLTGAQRGYYGTGADVDASYPPLPGK